MIIQSLLDTDLYKLTMMQGVFHQFPNTQVEYQFTCRTKRIDFSGIINDLVRETDDLCCLSFSDDDLNYLKKTGYFKKDFIDYLSGVSLQRDYVHLNQNRGHFSLSISGPWIGTILFEVPLLAIISELYFRHSQPNPDWTLARKKLQEKINLIKQAKREGVHISFSDFGTRRRFSKHWQETLLSILKEELPGTLSGTSNVDMAKRLGLTPVGTMAHEWLMACQALCPKLEHSQIFALSRWLDEYPQVLGLALSDVTGFDAFLRDFDKELASRYQGCRHDSGDPFKWGDRLIDHYASLSIDPMTKVAVFSDGLTVPHALEIARYFNGRINTAFGIGTNLTNDVSGEPIQIVIKMARCQGLPVAKLSDSPGKQSCTDKNYLDHLSYIFKGDSL